MSYAIAAPLVIATIVCILSTIFDLRDGFGEGTPATIFNAAQILACTVISFALFRHRRVENPSAARFWLFCAVFGFYLSLDEVFQFHEVKGTLLPSIAGLFDIQLGRTIPLEPLSWLSWGDVVICLYAAIALFLGIYYRKELKRGSLIFFSLAALLLGLSEFIDFGMHYEPGKRAYHRLLDPQAKIDRPYMSAIEEIAKIIGFSLVLSALIQRERMERLKAAR